MNQVTIIIPNYNGEAYLKECLQSLYQQKHMDFHCIVVDNGSMDNSVVMVKEEFPQVELMELKENTGFCHAVNLGVQKAKSPFVILLNNDTWVLPGFVEELYRSIQTDPSVFSVSSKMLSMQEPKIIDDCGDYYTVFGYALAGGKGKNADTSCLKPVKVFAACGGASIFRRDLYLELGMLDELHFAYLEDIDLGYRAKIKGYKNLFCPTAKVLHAGSGFSGSRYNEFKIRQSGKNNIYLIYKNMPFFQILINLPFLILGFLVKELFFIRKGFGKLYLNSLIEGIKFCNTEKAKQRKVPFEFRKCINYVTIQVELYINLFRLLFK